MQDNMPQTSPLIVHTVVLTSAGLASVFFLTLAVLQFLHITPSEQVFDAFKMAGTGVMSFFFGLLVNTRTTKPDEPAP